MKIHIFYRHYNIEGSDYKNRPYWFDFEKCFNNLLNTIKGKNVDLHLIMDGDVDTNFVKNYKDNYILHLIDAKSDQISFWETWKIVKQTSIDEKDLIYFLENDYLHMDNWVEEITKLFQTYPYGLNYVSLYDHNDKYFLPMYDDLVSKIYTTETRHWRTTPSTCGSFIIPKYIFEEDYNDHTSISGDHNKFLHLNKLKDRFILTPIPGLSTHCMESLLSPTIDWKQINN
jgi:hypothetical protein